MVETLAHSLTGFPSTPGVLVMNLGDLVLLELRFGMFLLFVRNDFVGRCFWFMSIVFRVTPVEYGFRGSHSQSRSLERTTGSIYKYP